MHLFTTALLFGPATIAVAAAATVGALIEQRADCADTHIFLAKGNNEIYPGRQGKLVSAICEGLSKCDYEDILFHGMIDDPMCDAVTEGAANGIAQVTAYHKRCPNAKLVLSGYSLGAHVVGDVIGGGGGRFANDCVQPDVVGIGWNTTVGVQIAAALLWADHRHVPSQSYNALSGANGTSAWPREGAQLAAINQYSDVLRAFCVATDPICAGGDVNISHTTYFDLYTEEAAAWVKSKLSSFVVRPVASGVTTTSVTSFSASAAAATATPAPASITAAPASISTATASMSTGTAEGTSATSSGPAAASITSSASLSKRVAGAFSGASAAMAVGLLMLFL